MLSVTSSYVLARNAVSYMIRPDQDFVESVMDRCQPPAQFKSIFQRGRVFLNVALLVYSPDEEFFRVLHANRLEEVPHGGYRAVEELLALGGSHGNERSLASRARPGLLRTCFLAHRACERSMTAFSWAVTP